MVQEKTEIQKLTFFFTKNVLFRRTVFFIGDWLLTAKKWRRLPIGFVHVLINWKNVKKNVIFGIKKKWLFSRKRYFLRKKKRLRHAAGRRKMLVVIFYEKKKAPAARRRSEEKACRQNLGHFFQKSFKDNVKNMKIFTKLRISYQFCNPSLPKCWFFHDLYSRNRDII